MPEFKAHLFVCTNDRGPGAKRESCSSKGADRLRAEVKKLCAEAGLPKGSVRINGSGCLDQCEKGMVAVLYPSGEWFENLQPGDAPKLVAAVVKAAKAE
jgi:(2Fe-2S) ferredoxin